MSHLHEELSQIWLKIQGSLFPWLEGELDPLSEKQCQLIKILEIIRKIKGSASLILLLLKESRE